MSPAACSIQHHISKQGSNLLRSINHALDRKGTGRQRQRQLAFRRSPDRRSKKMLTDEMSPRRLVSLRA